MAVGEDKIASVLVVGYVIGWEVLNLYLEGRFVLFSLT